MSFGLEFRCKTLDGMFSFTLNSIPPPYLSQFLRNILHSCIRNCRFGKDRSTKVSDIKHISILLVIYQFLHFFHFVPWIILTHFSPVPHFYTPWKRQKTFGFLTFSRGIEYGVFSGLYFPAFGLNPYLSVFSPNVGKYGPEKMPCLDTFQAVLVIVIPQTCLREFFKFYYSVSMFCIFHFSILCFFYCVASVDSVQATVVLFSHFWPF